MSQNNQERLVKVILDTFTKEADLDTKEVIKEVDKHGLVDSKTGLPNPESWGDPTAGFFDMKDFAKILASAILEAIELDTEEIKKIVANLIDEFFPKGKCKKRGQAIVLCAKIIIAIASAKERVVRIK